MITISDRAVQELQRAIDEHKQQDSAVGEVYVRVGVVGGGCSGFKNTLALEEGITDKDTIYEVSGLKVIIDNRSAMYLENVKLDYIDDLNRRGFKFDSPGQKKTCGCGMSFSYE